MEYEQRDVYDVLDLIEAEGRLCEECPDPGLCMAEEECMRSLADGSTLAEHGWGIA